MADQRTSPNLTLALLAVAAAIVFHAWWPDYKERQDREAFVSECMEITRHLSRADCIQQYNKR